VLGDVRIGNYYCYGYPLGVYTSLFSTKVEII